MKEEIANTLKEYGLSDKEIEVFLYIVENNGITAYQIANGTKVFKSTCYDVLERLIEKGFVSKSQEDKKMIYSARDITEIIGIVKSKEELLLSLITKIKNLESKEKTLVKHIDSENAFLGIDFKIAELAKKQDLTFVYMLSNNPHITTKSSTLLIQRLIKELSNLDIKKKIKCCGLWDVNFKNDSFMKVFSKLGENKFTELPSQATTIIFDGYVVFFYMEDNPNIIEIKNKKISQEMKSYFELLWKQAKP
jgi:predicted transcriptional regulator